jgi:hypothetical protein
MPYYKDPHNKVHHLDSEQYENLLPAGSVRVTDEEAAELLKPPPESPEQAAKRLELALDAHIDSVAQSYRYDSIRTMVTYATSDNSQFGAEGRAAVKFRDACYVKAIEIQDAVQAGQRDIPTQAELIAEMPSFESFL